MDEQDSLKEAAKEFGCARARHDLAKKGHFDNRFPSDTPEHEGYEQFAEKHRRAVARFSDFIPK